MQAIKSKSKRHGPRPHIGVYFSCCRIYARLYLNAARTAYTGHCPRCCAGATAKTAPGGSRQRFWTAG